MARADIVVTLDCNLNRRSVKLVGLCPNDHREYVEILKASVEYILYFVDDFLDISWDVEKESLLEGVYEHRSQLFTLTTDAIKLMDLIEAAEDRRLGFPRDALRRIEIKEFRLRKQMYHLFKRYNDLGAMGVPMELLPFPFAPATEPINKPIHLTVKGRYGIRSLVMGLLYMEEDYCIVRRDTKMPKDFDGYEDNTNMGTEPRVFHPSKDGCKCYDFHRLQGPLPEWKGKDHDDIVRPMH